MTTTLYQHKNMSEDQFKKTQLKSYLSDVDKKNPSYSAMGMEIETLLGGEILGDLSADQELHLQWFRDLFTWEISGGHVTYGTEVYVSDQYVDVRCNSVEQIRALWSGDETPEVQINGRESQPLVGSFYTSDLMGSDFEVQLNTDPTGLDVSIRNLRLRDEVLDQMVTPKK